MQSTGRYTARTAGSLNGAAAQSLGAACLTYPSMISISLMQELRYLENVAFMAEGCRLVVRQPYATRQNGASTPQLVNIGRQRLCTWYSMHEHTVRGERSACPATLSHLSLCAGFG